jgi:hypothetical protein
VIVSVVDFKQLVPNSDLFVTLVFRIRLLDVFKLANKSFEKCTFIIEMYSFFNDFGQKRHPSQTFTMTRSEFTTALL